MAYTTAAAGNLPEGVTRRAVPARRPSRCIVAARRRFIVAADAVVLAMAIQAAIPVHAGSDTMSQCSPEVRMVLRHRLAVTGDAVVLLVARETGRAGLTRLIDVHLRMDAVVPRPVSPVRGRFGKRDLVGAAGCGGNHQDRCNRNASQDPHVSSCSRLRNHIGSLP